LVYYVFGFLMKYSSAIVLAVIIIIRCIFLFSIPLQGQEVLLYAQAGIDTIPKPVLSAQPSLADSSLILLPEVRVEEQHNQQRLKEESLRVEVVGSDFIQKHQSGSLMQTLRRLPGIQAVSVGSGQSKPLIRGLGFNRIVVTEHGIKHEGQQWGADHALEVDQFALDYIELIKGPAALLYGSDAIGGVVQLSNRTLPEPHTLSANLNLVGRSSNQLLGTSAELKGRTQKWYFTSRFTILDYADSRVPADSVDVYSFKVPLNDNLLRNTAGNELSLHFSAGYLNQRVNSRFFISNVRQRAGFFANAHGLEPRRVDTDLYDRSSRDILYPRQDARHFKVVNRTVVDWGKSLLISESGFQNNFREEFSQYVNHGYRPPVFPDTLGIPTDLERSFQKHTFSSNIRLVNQLGNDQKLTAGLSVEYQNNNIGGISFMIPAFRLLSGGGYLMHELEVNEHMNISGGLRYDGALLRTESYTDWFPSNDVYLQRAEKLERKFGSFSGMFGINYHKGKSIFRLNLGRSFRVPLAKELTANGVNYHHFSYEIGDPSLQPEIAWQMDFGAEYLAKAWQVRVSPFISYFPNYIYLNPSYAFDFENGAGNQIFNYIGSEVMRWGSELMVMAEPVENLSVELSGEYVYSEQLSGDKKGFTIPFSPPASVLAGMSWSPLAGSFSAVIQSLVISADARYTLAQNSIVPPEKKTPGYTVFNLRLSGNGFLAGSRMQWNFAVNNIFNALYLEHTSYYRLIGVPEPGRNFTLSVNIPLDIIKHGEPDS
jgi:iron complex outermembrane recepter protein